jgi:hypothetical protein
VVTDGPLPDSNELLAGYRMADVASPERAIEIAAQGSAAPGPGGAPIKPPIEVREVTGGWLIPLAERDRRLWDKDLIGEGVALNRAIRTAASRTTSLPEQHYLTRPAQRAPPLKAACSQ